MKSKMVERIFIIGVIVEAVLFLAVVITAATSLGGGNLATIITFLTIFLILIEVVAIGLLVYYLVLFFQEKSLENKEI